MKAYRIREENERDRRAARQDVVLGACRPVSSNADRCIQCGTCVAACRPTRSASTRTPTCPSWSRCAPAARCAGISARGEGCVTRPCGRRRPSPARRRTSSSRGRRRGAVGCGRQLLEDHRRSARPTASAPWSMPTRPGPGRAPTTSRTAGWVSALLIARTGRWGDRRRPGDQTERRPRRALEGVAHLATTAKEINEAAGSYYNQTMALAELDLSKYDLPAKPRSRWWARPARSRDPGHAVAAVADRGHTGSIRWSSPSPCSAPRASTTRGSCSSCSGTTAGIDIERVSKVDVIRAG